MNDLNRRQLIRAGAAGIAALAVGAGDAEARREERQQGTSGRLKGKVALITGAAQGIGRATAIALAREGADIAFCDLGEQLKTARYPMGTPELRRLEKNAEHPLRGWKVRKSIQFILDGDAYSNCGER